jgi:hypothetical protein
MVPMTIDGERGSAGVAGMDVPRSDVSPRTISSRAFLAIGESLRSVTVRGRDP